MRITSENLVEGKSEHFKKIYIIPSAEGDINFVVLVPNKTDQITFDSMHDHVKTGLNTFAQDDSV